MAYLNRILYSIAAGEFYAAVFLGILFFFVYLRQQERARKGGAPVTMRPKTAIAWIFVSGLLAGFFGFRGLVRTEWDATVVNADYSWLYTIYNLFPMALIIALAVYWGRLLRYRGDASVRVSAQPLAVLTLTCTVALFGITYFFDTETSKRTSAALASPSAASGGTVWTSPAAQTILQTAAPLSTTASRSVQPEKRTMFETSKVQYFVLNNKTQTYIDAVMVVKNTGETPLASDIIWFTPQTSNGTKLETILGFGLPPVIHPGETSYVHGSKIYDEVIPPSAIVDVVSSNAIATTSMEKPPDLDISAVKISPTATGMRATGIVTNNTGIDVRYVRVYVLVFDVKDKEKPVCVIGAFISSTETKQFKPGDATGFAGEVSLPKGYLKASDYSTLAFARYYRIQS